VASRALDEAGATVLLINDITEQHEAQQRESRRQRLASMGGMTANLAHQLRTPLSTCLLYAAPLGDDAITSEQRRHFHTRLIAGMRHLERLVRDMLTFVRGRETARAVVTAAELLNDASQMMEPQAECGRVRLGVRDRAGAARVIGCRKSLVGALYNLLDNALNACQPGGHIELHAAVDSGMLRLAVRDDGAGIPLQARERLFEPFFTTRADGNGLGLSIVRSVARAHGGDVDIVAAPGQGSEFVISLPLAAATDGGELQHHA
jgi:two-component system sensor histidine kinase FlrB